MPDIPIANAPCSWGTLEFEGLEGERIAYGQMLDELRDSGYVGTEPGDWGYMPTDPAILKRELDGVFCELGKGNVPFAAIAEQLHKRNYHGWIVVEQDVLPGMGSPKASAQRNRDYLRAIRL